MHFGNGLVLLEGLKTWKASDLLTQQFVTHSSLESQSSLKVSWVQRGASSEVQKLRNNLKTRFCFLNSSFCLSP